MLDVMMALGSFRFSMDTAAFDDFQRTTGFNWSEQARIGTNPALQFVGKETETINLKGLIYPEFKGGFKQIEEMRRIGHEGKALRLVSGLGDNLGQWVISSVTDTQTIFTFAGLPQKMEFRLSLKRYDDPNLKNSNGSQFSG